MRLGNRHLSASTVNKEKSKPVAVTDWMWYLTYGEEFTFDPEYMGPEEIILMARELHGTIVEQVGPNRMRVVGVEGGVKVKETDNVISREEYEHPSYCMVGLSRTTSGRGSESFGSSIKSCSHVVLKVSPAAMIRTQLHGEMYMARGLPIVEVRLTQLQFAELITNMNVGDGVPGTVEYKDGDRVRYQPPLPTSAREQAARAFKEVMKDTEKDVQEAWEELEEILAKPSINKADREKIRNMARISTRKLKDSMPFVEERFHEATRKTVNEAKAEIDGTITGVITKLGKDALMNRGGLPEGASEMILPLERGDG
jgi:hypothetical protein